MENNNKVIEFTDKVINCKVCNTEVTLTADHQKWFADRKLHQPTKCADCIKAAKAQNHSGQEKKAA